jgi:phage gp46-like protein
MAKMTDYEQKNGDFVNLTDSVDLTDTTTIQILLRVMVDAEYGADKLVQDLESLTADDTVGMNVEELRKRRDALRRAKQRANEYGVLRNNLKRMLRDA